MRALWRAFSPRVQDCCASTRRDRSDFLRAFYRRYEGAPVDQLRFDSYELFSDLLGLRAFPDAIARVRHHRALGHRTLLITGALDFVVEPLRPLFDEIVCAHMGERHGKLTGELTDAPPTGEGAGAAARRVCRSQGEPWRHCLVCGRQATCRCWRRLGSPLL